MGTAMQSSLTSVHWMCTKLSGILVCNYLKKNASLTLYTLKKISTWITTATADDSCTEIAIVQVLV